MSKSKKLTIPQFRFHRHSNQHYIWHNNKRVHMGAELEVAEARYNRWVADFVAGIRTPKPAKRTTPNPSAERTVAEVLVADWKHVLIEYADNKSTRHRIWQAIEAVREMYSDISVFAFRGPQLKALRADLVENRKHKHNGKPISRTYINYLVACVQRMWKWALSEDLVPADGAETIAAVEPLAKGKGGREPKRVLPPAVGWDECFVELPPVLTTMIRVQALCGMRPQDVCRMKRGEISTAPSERVAVPDTGRYLAAFVEAGVPVWVYVPAKHKATWQGKPRAVVIGPQAQALLRPLLEILGPDDYVFSPGLALEQRRRGNRDKGKGYGRHYQTRHYAQFITRAVDRTNRPRVAARWLAEELVPFWSPNQLRHLAATVVGDELDREHARVMLGQSSADVIDVYMEQQLRKAARAAAKCG